mgnify:FL=1
MTSTSDTAPGYFGDAARAAWNEITAGRDLHGAGDRLRAEQAALLLAEMRAAPELFGASKHAQLRALLGELLPPAPRSKPDPEAEAMAELNRAIDGFVAEEEAKRAARAEKRRQRRQAAL